MGEDADWAPEESYSTGPTLQSSPLRAEPASYRDAVLSVPRSMNVGTHSVSTVKSARTERSVKADLESSRTATAVKEETD